MTPQLTIRQREMLRFLNEHPEIAISWSGPLSTLCGLTEWERGWPYIRFGTFKALLRRNLLVAVALRPAQGAMGSMRYYRPVTRPEWLRETP